MSFLKRYITFLTSLERVARAHEELIDTEARERLFEVVDYFFVWQKGKTSSIPKTYAMFSAAGNQAVAKITRTFIVGALAYANAENIPPGPARHALLRRLKPKSRAWSTYETFLRDDSGVTPATKPAPDAPASGFPIRGNGKRSPFPLPSLAISVRGKRFVPTFDPTLRTFVYDLPYGSNFGVIGSSIEEIRASAVAVMNDFLNDKKWLRAARRESAKRK